MQWPQFSIIYLLAGLEDVDTYNIIYCLGFSFRERERVLLLSKALARLYVILNQDSKSSQKYRI